MSILKVNELRPQSGSNVTIQSGYTLRLGSKNLDSSSVMPSPSGQNGKILVSNGSSRNWEDHGAVSMSVWTSSGTWSRPSGVKRILVRIAGAGGAGSGVGEAGGAGGYAEEIIDVTGVSSISVTVGQPGSWGGTYYSGGAANGGTTSFGNYMSASGGNGANRNYQHCGGLPGVGSGGNLNIYGGGGSGHEYWSGYPGGGSFFGGAGATGHPRGGHYAYNHQYRAAKGSGGSPGYHRSRRGARGMAGVVCVWNFR